jgi:hypothetical protein
MQAELLADTTAVSAGGVGQPELPFGKAPGGRGSAIEYKVYKILNFLKGTNTCKYLCSTAFCKKMCESKPTT